MMSGAGFRAARCVVLLRAGLPRYRLPTKLPTLTPRFAHVAPAGVHATSIATGAQGGAHGEHVADHADS
jgi:hypothetical protein